MTKGMTETITRDQLVSLVRATNKASNLKSTDKAKLTRWARSAQVFAVGTYETREGVKCPVASVFGEQGSDQAPHYWAIDFDRRLRRGKVRYSRSQVEVTDD